jgi:mRNA interferase MazF
MKRGEIWTVSGSGDYDGKPRPAVIVQNDAFDATKSIVICPLTSDPTNSPLLRLTLEANQSNGVRTASHMMVDKIAAVPKAKLGKRIGALSAGDIARLDRAMLVFLGLAG